MSRSGRHLLAASQASQGWGGSQHARCARSVVRAAHGRRGFGLSEAAGPTGQKLPSFVLPAPGELVVHFPHLHGHRGAVFVHSRIHRHS